MYFNVGFVYFLQTHRGKENPPGFLHQREFSVKDRGMGLDHRFSFLAGLIALRVDSEGGDEIVGLGWPTKDDVPGVLSSHQLHDGLKLFLAGDLLGGADAAIVGGLGVEYGGCSHLFLLQLKSVWFVPNLPLVYYPSL